MAEKPVVQDSATSLRWGLIAIPIGVVLAIIGANQRAEALGLVGVIVVVLGLIWLIRGLVAGAQNRDAMARALLEREDRER